ncbi:MAG: hypothetical protein A4E57_03633 [Syntrophorhabdaceae bacterium PtaU1.Bin034]|nr:MAG: hypothetical protein A4E57_03633 [Syntrophorhabdaceae bacterium PtaU1.Bin034]
MPNETSAPFVYWPSLPLKDWQDTYATLQLFTQIVGKVRLKQAPLINHWWQVPLYVTPRGLTTSAIPHGERTFEVQFDFIDHRLIVHASGEENASRSFALAPYSVAEFYGQFMDTLRSLGLQVRIWPVPVEVETRIPFDQDRTHAAYDPEYANRLWRILVQSERVFQLFRSRFIGKCSPVHFFWGAFDLAVTRFSGRRAPDHPPAPYVAHYVVLEAYSHEVSSCGFWPGGGVIEEPAYYSYAYPEPEGFRDYVVRPESAYYSSEMGEFILPYDAVRLAEEPDKMLLAFLQSTYVAAAETGLWDRTNLERLVT